MISSRASRDLPIPASPSITASTPSGRAAAYAPSSAASCDRRGRRAAAPPAGATGRAAAAGATGAGATSVPSLHLLEQRRGLVHRRHAELLAERAHTVAVLRERRRPVAVERVQADQLAVRGLVQRIEREPALRVADRAAVLAALGERAHEPPER